MSKRFGAVAASTEIAAGHKLAITNCPVCGLNAAIAQNRPLSAGFSYVKLGNIF
jgi:hypothetical protein